MRPEYVKVGNTKYKINTDFRIALRCNEISLDKTIGEYEKALAIIYTLYGDKGLDAPEDYERLLELGFKYLLRGEEREDRKQTPDMDFMQDESYIYASFMSDYHIDLKDKEMHWWEYLDLLNGLTEHCVLNRVRDIRTYDLSEIKDAKARAKIEEAQRSVALKEIKPQKTLMDEYLEILERSDVE